MDYQSYDQTASSSWGMRMYDDIARTIVQRVGITTGRLLDLGCGPGHLALAVAKLGTFTDITFSDLQPEALDFARIHAVAISVPCHYVCADVADLPLPDAAFDLVISRGSLPFWEDQVGALSEIRRVLAPGGRAYIGGGRGSAAFQALRIEQDPNYPAEWKPGGHRHAPWRNSPALESTEYLRILRGWGCEATAFETDGRWLCFDRGTGAS